MEAVGHLPWVDEHQIADRYPVLYHYTRVAALKPILASGGMRATHFAHTNDAEEFHGARDLFPQLMAAPAFELAKRLRAQGAFKRAPSNAELKRIIAADAGGFHDAMVRSLPLPFHLTCFSKHASAHHNANGLLTLWRFYGGAGEGIALGFNTRKLIDATEVIQKKYAIAAIYLDEVRYGSDDEVLCRRMYDATGLVEMFLEFVDSLINQRVPDFDGRGVEMHQFTVLAACAKHPDFVDEREIRLIVTPAFSGYEEGRLSAYSADERYMLLPYLNALERIIIGPSPEQEALAERVRIAVREAGLESISVDRSKTPFRFVQR